ncbi:MAG TPA: hypothetical protein VJ742_04590 [Nitrososphaera sp.]|nr:hypothetical protein [Nitrososphaera sp.]
MSLLVRRFSGNLIDTLMTLRRKALRTGIWFRSLSVEDRILANLIERHVKIVKNTTLATVIARIMGKLLVAIKNTFLDRLVMAGRPIAEAVAMKAYSYGNKEALGWTQDLNYVKYMGLTYSSVTRQRTARTGSGMMIMQERMN